MSVYITKMYDRIDRIVFDRYGSTDNRLVEWVIEQNNGLEINDILLPLGLAINLPDPPVKPNVPKVVPQVFLWT